MHIQVCLDLLHHAFLNFTVLTALRIEIVRSRMKEKARAASRVLSFKCVHYFLDMLCGILGSLAFV